MSNMNSQKTKTTPKVGDQLYLRVYTGSYYADMVKRPYTVISVTPSKVKVQSAKLVFPIFEYDPETMDLYYAQFDGRRVCFYDTVAESIEPDPEGRVKELTWHPGRGMWGTPGPDSSYPEYAIFGKYEHQPYLD